MNYILLIVLSAFTAISAFAQKNVIPANSFLLDDKMVIDLTAGLKEYEDPPTVTGKVKSVGSGLITIMINRWVAEFATLHPEVEFDISGGGSVNGMEKLLTGEVDLVPMSRALSETDLARFKSKFGYEPAQILVAQDAIGVYVNKDNPLTQLTLAQLDAIFSRESRRGGGHPEFWIDLGVSGSLKEERIVRLGLVRAHGTHTVLQEEVLQGADYRFDVRFEPVSSSLVQGIGGDPAAIGCGSVMFGTARTRFVPLQGDDGAFLLPNYENTVTRRYPLVRSLLIVFNRKPDGTMNPASREFLRFVVSRRGQRIMALAQGYPLTSDQQAAALRTIGESAESSKPRK